MASEITTDTGVMYGIHLDIGHASIGWAINEVSQPVIFKGCGTVLFPKDGCLASKRRQTRRQRRHVRSTRRRISRMAALLASVGVLTSEELARPGGAWPWKLAAEALSLGRNLSWPELWDVLRWYAHNRGYDGNRLWSRDADDEKEQRDSLENARALMAKHHTDTMAGTVCAMLGIVPGGAKCAGMKRYKSKKEGASFPREVVAGEARCILEAHKGVLPGVTDDMIRALLGSPSSDPEAWQAIPCAEVRLPRRYVGGLLFGQLAPRFDNRIIGECPVSGEKLPLKRCPEFLEYRWAMLLANIRVRRPGSGDITPLSGGERRKVTRAMREKGYFTRGTLKKAVQEAAGTEDSNLDDMLSHPDAEEALILHPPLREVHMPAMAKLWPLLPAMVQRRLLSKLAKGRAVALSEVRGWLDDPSEFDRVLRESQEKSRKKDADPLKATVKANYPAGRAPYARGVMRQAAAEVMDGREPREEGGCLYGASRAGIRLTEQELDKRTNNHMVRHRLKIMRRLLTDIVEVYAQGDKSRIDHVTIEVNRDVKDLSGMTAKQIGMEMGVRLRSHKAAVEYASKELGIPPHRLGGSLIRKVRIAMDLGWTCPYTGQMYDIRQVRSGAMDLDHIIPHSKRTSDSLDSLVLTFKQVNLWKSNRSALDFITAEGGKVVPGAPNLSILSPARYAELVEALSKMKAPHKEDQRRIKSRCARLLQRMTDEGAARGFTPRDLTVSSHLVKLAFAVANDFFQETGGGPVVRNVPGRITKEVRMGWKIMDLLATVNPLVLGEDNTLKTKTEIREVTHLHHAVDAVTLGLASDAIPADGTVWALMLRRRIVNAADRALMDRAGAFRFDADGRPSLRDLPEETRQSILNCLKERRVITHIPARRHGAALEENTRGIVSVEDGVVTLRQRSSNEKGEYQGINVTKVSTNKILGIEPSSPSKLKAIGGALVITENFGVALDPTPEVIPFHHVWRRIGEIKKRNNGKTPRIIRNGMIIHVEKGTYAGTWRVCSVKDAAAKIMLDIALADMVKLQNKTPGVKINAGLKSLLDGGLTILPLKYTGVSSCPTT